MNGLKILVLGASGMLGHKLVERLSRDFEVYGTTRRTVLNPGVSETSAKILEGLDFAQPQVLDHTVETVRPDVVINCVGIVKQLDESGDHVKSIEINALLPQRLAAICVLRQIRLIHLSTDCVFSGVKGNYSELDRPDCDDLYGLSKRLGEVVDKSNSLTLRTSMIGRQVDQDYGLVEWFLKQNGKKVSGYKNSIFSGFPTVVLADIIRGILVEQPNLHGLYHLSADPISKFDLLHLIRESYKLDIEIEPETNFRCDRSLDSTKFKSATGFHPAPWSELIESMRDDETAYAWKKKTVSTF